MTSPKGAPHLGHLSGSTLLTIFDFSSIKKEYHINEGSYRRGWIGVTGGRASAVALASGVAWVAPAGM